jgi:putative NADH-flavin reductase
MSRIVIFGAGGRAGRRLVAEAAARGHQVTAVVRDPARHPDLTVAGAGLLTGADLLTGTALVTGDVTSAAGVAAVSAGQDVVINAAGRLDIPAEQFFPAAARALLEGLSQAGVGRLIVIGIGTVLEIAPGVAGYQAEGFPEVARAFSLGHALELEVLRVADPAIDWLVIAPPPTMLDDEAPRSGHYRLGGAQVLPTVEGAPLFAYADLAVAVIDQIEAPTAHRALIAVAP